MKSVSKYRVSFSRKGEKDQTWHWINQRSKAAGCWGVGVEVTTETQLFWESVSVGSHDLQQKPDHRGGAGKRMVPKESGNQGWENRDVGSGRTGPTRRVSCLFLF